jgi:hypothetical protein
LGGLSGQPEGWNEELIFLSFSIKGMDKMDQLNTPFSSQDAVNILTTKNIVWAFKSAIIDFIEQAEVKTKEDEEKKKSIKHDDDFSFTYHNPFLIPLKELLQLLEWEYRKPFTYSIDNELLRLKDAIVARNLFEAVRIALQEWQYEFFQHRQDNELHSYDVTYKQEMLTAIEMEIKYSLYNQNRETVAFRKYLANEQAITLLLNWDFSRNNTIDDKSDKTKSLKSIKTEGINEPTEKACKVKSDIPSAYEPKDEVAEAVRLHNHGDTWPDLVFFEIQEPLFRIAGSIPKASALFCKIYHIPEYETALIEAIKRRNRKKKKSNEKKKNDTGSIES